MDMDTAATVLAGSILTGLAFIVFVVTAVVINNILHKYWKPVRLFTPDSWTAFNPPLPKEEINAKKETGLQKFGRMD